MKTPKRKASSIKNLHTGTHVRVCAGGSERGGWERGGMSKMKMRQSVLGAVCVCVYVCQVTLRVCICMHVCVQMKT